MVPVKEAEFERTFDAPVKTIWQAWTTPELLKQWWGPDNVTIPECELDLRVGGKLRLVMEASEGMGEYKGVRWPMEGVFTVVEEGSKLAYTAKAWTEGQEETTEIDQIAELTLHEEGGRTKMNLKATVTKIGPNAGMAIEGMKWGYNQQFDKLEKFLAR